MFVFQFLVMQQLAKFPVRRPYCRYETSGYNVACFVNNCDSLSQN